MIAYIEGRLAEVCANACVVVTEGGVGYEVYLPQQTRLQLPERGGHVRFYICHIVREDAQELFVLRHGTNGRLFIVLTSISKVGARTALGILSASAPTTCGAWCLRTTCLRSRRFPVSAMKSCPAYFP